MSCFKCRGTLVERKVNYVVDLDSTIIIVKGVPASVCEACGEKYYDDETAKNIENIINSLKQLSVEVSIVNYADKVHKRDNHFRANCQHNMGTKRV